MISGYTGEAFRTDIFIGPVYYQRLRHMVSDKFQVHRHSLVTVCSLAKAAKFKASFGSRPPYSTIPKGCKADLTLYTLTVPCYVGKN